MLAEIQWVKRLRDFWQQLYFYTHVLKYTYTNTHSGILLLNELIQRERKKLYNPEKEIILSSAPPLWTFTQVKLYSTLLKYQQSVKSNTRPI